MREKKMQPLQTFVPCLLAIYTLSLSVQSCIKQEREALLTFKAGVHDPSNRLASWRGNECCNWQGVRCSNQTGQIAELDLSTSCSYLKYPGCKNHILRGRISASLLALSGLEYLDLSWNNFGEGTQIPFFIGTFEKLKYLNLSNSGFSGIIPPQLGNLSRLQYLDLSNNYEITASADISWLSFLQSLRQLDISQVNLQDSEEWVQSLNKLPALEVLILDNNSLIHIPQSLPFVNFTSLRVLHLSNQNFSTTIPDWIFSLHTLTDLNLEQCNFVGFFPVALGNLTSLSKLDLGCSALQGKPPPLNNLTKLTYINLSCILNGQPIDITEVLSKLSHETRRRLEGLVLYDTHLTGTLTGLASESRNLKYLDLSTNKLSGPMPDTFWNLTNLVEVDLSYNSFTGSLTDVHLNHLSKLEIFLLGENQLEGKIPTPPYDISVIDLSDNRFEQFPDSFEAPKLQELSLVNNRITGTIIFPLCRFTSLQRLDISGNNISGFDANCLPDITQGIHHVNNNPTSTALSSLNCSDFLQEIYLDNNSFTGGFPSLLQSCRGLKYLDLGENNFHGEIPQWIGENLNKLIVLRMHSNLFSGNIPSNLALLNKLRVLDLADNNLSGPLPENLGSFTGMSSLKYVDKLPFDPLFKTIEDLYLEYDSWYPELPTKIDLSNNYLTGEIPRKIIALRGLANLNLSQNQLIGEIPAEIGRMISLQSLDLHSNKLSGTIPVSISALNSLKVLDLSYNNLSGSIPTGHELHKLNASFIYIGNPYLCGPAQENNCTSTRTSSASNSKAGHIIDRGMWWVYMIIEVSFMIGCSVVFGVLLFLLVSSIFKRYGKQ
jgi:Leucine-rich repeat (LRR) protein